MNRAGISLVALLGFAIFFSGCFLSAPEYDEELISHVSDSMSYPTDSISIDSLMSMAQNAIIQHQQKETSNRSYVDSLSTAIVSTKKISQEDKAELASKLSQIYTQNQSYKQELDDYKTRKIVTKDSIIYNIQYIDSSIYIRDTIIIYDTIRKKRKKRRK